MTTPAKKPAAPRAAAAKTTTRTPAARATARPATSKAAPKAAPAAVVAAPAPEYNFAKPYKMLTGLDDAAFCDKVSAHLNAGYKLAGSASITSVAGKIFVGQAVYKHSNVAKPKAKPKAKGKKK